MSPRIRVLQRELQGRNHRLRASQVQDEFAAWAVDANHPLSGCDKALNRVCELQFSASAGSDFRKGLENLVAEDRHRQDSMMAPRRFRLLRLGSECTHPRIAGV